MSAEPLTDRERKMVDLLNRIEAGCDVIDEPLSWDAIEAVDEARKLLDEIDPKPEGPR